MKTKSHGGYYLLLSLPCNFLRDKIQISRFHFWFYSIALFLLGFTCPSSNCQPSSFPIKNSSFSKLDPGTEINLYKTLKQNSLRFQLIENNGQSGLPSDVLAYFSTRNQTVFIEKDRLRIVVTGSIANKKTSISASASFNPASLKNAYRYNTFSIHFKGSAGFSTYEKNNRFTTERNFFNGPSGKISASSYGEIILKNMYRGIDLRLYSQENGQLEFDWIVWPGANPDAIRMEFAGQDNLSITPKSGLQVKLGMGSFTMHLPESYYIGPAGKVMVDAKFSLASKNEVRFTCAGKWQKRYPLVIDPDLLWGTFFDGGDPSFDEYLYGLDFNNSNELLYCIGAVNMQIGSIYTAAIGLAYDAVVDVPTDALIYALTKNGQTIQYITYLGGGDADVAIGVSITNSFIYVCGRTSSADFPVTKAVNGKFPAYDSVYEGNIDGFVAVFNPQLDDLIYCSYLGGTGDDRALTIRSVSDSSFYVSLAITNPLPVSPDYLVNAADNAFGGSSEAWLAKFSSFHTLNFGTYVGGNGDDLVNDFQVLSNGDLVFTGNTAGITEVNGTLSNTGFGQHALFGRLQVPASGAVSFDILDQFGGSNDNYGWGIYSLGDSVSIVVGETNSNDFPLGTGTSFQNTRSGGYDGFIAKIYNNGASGYKASYTGGSDDDLLVAIRPVVVNNKISLLSFGTTLSTDLATLNFNSGTFFSANNSGNHEMMFVICDLNLTTKYYLSYIGGSANDYLGKTGAPIGSNHLFYNTSDTVLYLGTTTHSFENTQAPSFVGRGPADTANIGVPVFDKTKGNGINDTHVIIAISTRNLFFVLPVSWLNVAASLLPDCNVKISWDAMNQQNLVDFIVERSSDGRNFKSIGQLHQGLIHYEFLDKDHPATASQVYYRIRAEYGDGQKSFSTVHSMSPCQRPTVPISVYPTITKDYFSISGLDPTVVRSVIVEMLDESGKRVLIRRLDNYSGTQKIAFEKNPPRGAYIVAIKNANSGSILKTQTIIID